MVYECACFACTYHDGDMDITERVVYITAPGFTEAVTMFEERQFWRWKLVKIERIGRSLNSSVMKGV